MEGFERFVHTGVSRLQGETVRVPALRADGTEVELDLTIRVYDAPGGPRMAIAALSAVPLGHPPPGLLILEAELRRRHYQPVAGRTKDEIPG